MPRFVDVAVRVQRRYYTETDERYEAMHANEAAGDEAGLRLVTMLLAPLGVQSILDVGTATGRGLRNLREAFPEARICGIEPVRALLDQAVKLSNNSCGSLLCGSGEHLPFADASFDAVCEFGILHHVPQPERVVAEMLRVARKAVVIADSNRFGQGPRPMRWLKLALHKTHLWPLANYLKTGGKGYLVSEGDGVAYSYSVYDSFDQVAAWGSRVLLLPVTGERASSWTHPLLTCSTIVLAALKE
jgi:ubiquinone/menaquinone biosynthesis C-methylase UbiE